MSHFSSKWGGLSIHKLYPFSDRWNEWIVETNILFSKSIPTASLHYKCSPIPLLNQPRMIAVLLLVLICTSAIQAEAPGHIFCWIIQLTQTFFLKLQASEAADFLLDAPVHRENALWTLYWTGNQPTTSVRNICIIPTFTSSIDVDNCLSFGSYSMHCTEISALF